MATEKTFTVAGTSVLKGVCKVRFANDTNRVKVLDKNEHTDIRLIELSRAMTKAEAAEVLLQIPAFADELAQTTIKQFLDDVSGNKAPKEPKAAKPKVEVKPADTTEPTFEMQEAKPEEVEQTPAPELPKTADTISDEEAEILAMVSNAKG